MSWCSPVTTAGNDGYATYFQGYHEDQVKLQGQVLCLLLCTMKIKGMITLLK